MSNQPSVTKDSIKPHALMQERIKEIRTVSMFDKHVVPSLPALLKHIGVSPEEAENVQGKIKNIFLSSDDIFKVEDQLKRELKGCAPKMGAGLREEEDLVFSEVRPHLLPGNVLDIGSGSGLIGEKIAKDGFEVKLVDVINMNKSHLPFYLYDGDSLPFADNSFVNSLLLVVLHHCDHPEKVFEEAARVTKDNIVIIESVFVNEEERLSNTFYDWLWNRVFCDDVNVPFNFRSPSAWTEYFVANGWQVQASIDLGYDSPMTPEHHWLFSLRPN